MNLVIDVGNTNVVIGLFDGNLLLKRWFFASKKENTVDDYWILMNSLFTADYTISAIGISSVVPKITKALVELCKVFFSIDPLVVTQHNAGISIKVKSVIIGADRLVNIISALHDFPNRDILILDIGTATTFDLINKSGDYYGSVIAPGPEIIAESFSRSAAMLPPVVFTKVEKVVANSLTSSMESGLFWGYVSLITGLLERITLEENKSFFIIGTGGYINLVAPYIKLIEHSDINLTLSGINIFLSKYLI